MPNYVEFMSKVCRLYSGDTDLTRDFVDEGNQLLTVYWSCSAMESYALHSSSKALYIFALSI